MGREKNINEAMNYLIYKKMISSQEELAKKMSITKESVSRALNGNKSYLTDKFLNKFNETFDGVFDINWLLKGEGEMLRSSNIVAPVIVSNINKQPILDIRVSAGHGVGLEGSENEVVEWVNIPKFDGCYGIMVYGDSMYDRFKSGDVVFVRPIAGRNDFDYGQCYVVITNEDRYIKNIYESSKGNEYITMTSYNIEINPDGRRKYPDKDIYIDEIKHLYKVAGKLRRDQL